MQRGEIYLGSVTKDEARGHEQRNTDDDASRPWVVLSDGRIATRAKLVVACPLTSQTAKDERMDPFRVVIEQSMIVTAPSDQPFPFKPSLMLGEQIRAMSLARLGQRIGKLRPEALARVEEAILAVLQLDE